MTRCQLHGMRALKRFQPFSSVTSFYLGNSARNRQNGWAAMPNSAARNEVIGRLGASLLIAKCFPGSSQIFPAIFEQKNPFKAAFSSSFLGFTG
jgi:hypothetical protein